MTALEKIPHYGRGTSLLELLVTMSVVGVLFSAAIPSFIDFSVRNRIVSYSNEFISAINLARSEAIRRGTTVSICHSDDDATCSGSWSSGWIVFANTDGDSPAVVDAGEPLIRAFPSLSDNFTMQADAALATDVTFGPDGAAVATGAMSVCHDGLTEDARAIVITSLRPRVARDTDNNKIPNLDDGTDMVSCPLPSG